MKNLYLEGKEVFLNDAVLFLGSGDIESEEEVKNIFQQIIDKGFVDDVPPFLQEQIALSIDLGLCHSYKF